MLGEYLESRRREVVAEIASWVVSVERTDLLERERNGRLDGLVGELITALSHGGVAGTHGSEPTLREAETETRERELVERDVIDHIARKHVDATLDEIAILTDWACAGERKRLRVECRQLSALLDAVDEIATVYTSDGRLQYVNRRAAERIHETTGVPTDAILGKAAPELGLPRELGGCSSDELLSMAREERAIEANLWGRWKEGRFRAIYGPDGQVSAVTLVGRDIHDPRLKEIRLSILSRLGMLVGNVDFDDIPAAVARVPIPDLADWCAVSLVEGEEIRSTFIAQRDPGKAALRDALMAGVRGWNRHPLWDRLLTGGFQLLHDVSDDLQRRLILDDELYRMLGYVGIRSLLVVPIVSRGRAVGIITLAYTGESGRRYDRDDPELAQEMALHVALIMENARLLKELRAADARFHLCLEGARTIVFEQDAALRYRRIYAPFVPCPIVGKTDAEVLLPEDAARLTTLKRRALDRGEHVLIRTYG